jgi:hypothetical protein
MLVGWKTLYPEKTLENLHVRESMNYSKTRQTGSRELINKVQVDRFWSSTFTNMVALQYILASPRVPYQEKQNISMTI